MLRISSHTDLLWSCLPRLFPFSDVWEFLCVNCNVVGHFKGIRDFSYKICGASHVGVILNLKDVLTYSR